MLNDLLVVTYKWVKNDDIGNPDYVSQCFLKTDSNEDVNIEMHPSITVTEYTEDFEEDPERRVYVEVLDNDSDEVDNAYFPSVSEAIKWAEDYLKLTNLTSK